MRRSKKQTRLRFRGAVQQTQKLQPHHFFQSGAVAHHFFNRGRWPPPKLSLATAPHHSSAANQFGTQSLARWQGQVFYGCLTTSGQSVGLLLLGASTRACVPTPAPPHKRVCFCLFFQNRADDIMQPGQFSAGKSEPGRAVR